MIHRISPLFDYLMLLAYTVDLVIFACLGSREFVILGLFAMSRIRELSIPIIGSTIIIIIAKFSNSRICPREVREN